MASSLHSSLLLTSSSRLSMKSSGLELNRSVVLFTLAPCLPCSQGARRSPPGILKMNTHDQLAYGGAKFSSIPSGIKQSTFGQHHFSTSTQGHLLLSRASHLFRYISSHMEDLSSHATTLGHYPSLLFRHQAMLYHSMGILHTTHDTC